MSNKKVKLEFVILFLSSDELSEQLAEKQRQYQKLKNLYDKLKREESIESIKPVDRDIFNSRLNINTPQRQSFSHKLKLFNFNKES
jgi:glycerol-3-phosphate cytidylyltransferase-like family protein